MVRQGLVIALLTAATCYSTPVHSARLEHQLKSPFLQPPASARFMQTHEALLQNALKKADSESLVQLDKEGGVDYVLCAKTATHGPHRSDARAASTAVIAPVAAFLPEATVTFASEEDRSVIFKKLIAPKTFVSSQCSFGTHRQLFYGEVTSAEMLSGPTPAVKISVAWASPQQVCTCMKLYLVLLLLTWSCLSIVHFVSHAPTRERLSEQVRWLYRCFQMQSLFFMNDVEP